MYIHFDKQKMMIIINCGPLEEYKPNDNIKNIYKKVDKLKNDMEKYMKEKVQPSVEDIDKMILEENDKYKVEEKK